MLRLIYYWQEFISYSVCVLRMRTLCKIFSSICRRLHFLIKLQVLACNFIPNELWHKCFPVDLEKFLRTHFLQSTSGRRLLQIRQLLLPYRKNTHWRQMSLHKLLNTEGTSQKYFEKKAAVESWFCKYLQKLSRSLERFKQIKNELLKHC